MSNTVNNIPFNDSKKLVVKIVSNKKIANVSISNQIIKAQPNNKMTIVNTITDGGTW